MEHNNTLGTDRYPPFSLGIGDYPATLELEYPERLSHRLVLVKWLLLTPHYLVVAVLHGGFGHRYGGLNLILVFFAAVALLLAGR